MTWLWRKKFPAGRCNLSELTLDLQPNPLIPDVCTCPKFTPNWLEDEIKMTTMPLTVIEISSPIQSVYSFSEKMKLYFNEGVQSFWLAEKILRIIAIFIPDKTSRVYHQGQLTGPVTNISLKLPDIFGQ